MKDPADIETRKFLQRMFGSAPNGDLNSPGFVAEVMRDVSWIRKHLLKEAERKPVPRRTPR